MKKLFFLIAMAFSICSMAQSANPRWGITPNADNTYRGQKLGYRAFSDIAGKDTFTLVPNSLSTTIKVTVLDTVAFAINPSTSSLGDEMTFVVNNTSGASHAVLFTQRVTSSGTIPATNWQFGSGTAFLALTTLKSALISFVFNGTAWVEKYRLVQ